MPPIPRDRLPDSTFALLSEGYRFISNRCDRFESDIFQTRLLFQPVLCLRGEAAAKVFYDTEKFQRQGATPKRVQKTLLGEGGVQGLDGEAHRHRKDMLMSFMTRDSITHMVDLVETQWRDSIIRWEASDSIVLLPEVQLLLCRAVFDWAGVPLRQENVPLWADDLAAMIDGAGGITVRYWQAKRARDRAELRLMELIDDIRANRAERVPDGSPAAAIAQFRDLNGELLPARIAAVELLNLLRPTVAIARFIVFAALALYEYPHCRMMLKTDEDYLRFVQEVRRFYPFFPFAAARVRHNVEWNGYLFPTGWRTLLDLYGTNRDPALWDEPDRFSPERFRGWEGSGFKLIPQGGGDYYGNHRCAGEWTTIAVMTASVRILTEGMTYQVPEQDVSIDLGRIPAEPKSGFVISKVSRR